MGIAVLFVLLLGFCYNGPSSTAKNSTVPEVVNVGAIIPFNSTIGKVAKVAIEAALEDVNSDPHVLPATKLYIAMTDSNYSGFLGVVEALQIMERETVAIIGPQSSVVAHVVSHIANELQVPLLSYAATDPTLSSLQYPFFVRTTQSDVFQMAAIAAIVDHFGWKEVIAVYTDDDYGRNGIAALEDNLADKRCRITFKAALNPEPNRDQISSQLVKLALTESRILVLHTCSRFGLQVVEVARSLGMMDAGYVWIATNWLTDVLDTDSPLSSDALENMQGLISMRMHTPDSSAKRNFVTRWNNNLTNTETDKDAYYAPSGWGLNTFGLYAYDTVWILARALDAYFAQGGIISFSEHSEVGNLSIFLGGQQLLRNILRTNMTGLTGLVQYDLNRNLVHPAYEIINVIGTGYRKVGYWSNYSGLSIHPPETLYSQPPNLSTSSQQLYSVFWPGKTFEKPRGWVFSNNGNRLKIGVPNRVSYREIISYSESTDTFSGYSIDVFNAALNLLPYAVPHRLIPVGNGRNNPSINGLIEDLNGGVFEAAIGDIAITTNRTRIADFTQPYIESGLVIVAPVRTMKSNAWAFLRPYTPTMWCVTAVFLFLVGVVVWILEHRMNDDFRGPPRKQLGTILWFGFSTMFSRPKVKTVSILGRLVLGLWLFVVLIIKSSYIASLTSMLAVQKLSSPIKGFQTLMNTNDPIGYQEGSFARNYLVEELNIHASRLVALSSADAYAEALRKGPKNGGVTAVVDERAYMELFLSTRCEFTIVGQEFTRSGWGFAFPRDSPLAVDMSTSLLKLSENGDLQRIHDKWLTRSACSSQGAKLSVYRLDLSSFWGLFLVCGLVCLLALLVYLYLVVRQFLRHFPEEESADPSTSSVGGPSSSSKSRRLSNFLSFADEKEEEVKSRHKAKKSEKASNRGGSTHIEEASSMS